MRARFTSDEIAAAALRIVDESGLGALSMRSLAAALGTGPMTMYNYVADKEGLEELVVAAVVADVAIPEPTDDWRTTCTPSPPRCGTACERTPPRSHSC